VPAWPTAASDGGPTALSPTPDIDLHPIVDVAASSTHLLVALHGHADEPSTLSTVARSLASSGDLATLLPRGPVDAGGRPAWFASEPDDRGPALADTLDALDALIDETCRTHGLDRSATALVGYSQGAAAALALSFRVGHAPRPAQVLSHAAWLPDEPGIDWAFGEATAVRVLLSHGTHDDVVPVQQGRSVARVLERHGVDVELVEVDAGHALADFPVDEALRWLVH
jgi:phospholipase/carboxylesterase